MADTERLRLSDKDRLLRAARAAIAARIGRGESPKPIAVAPGGRLGLERGAFVTLHTEDGELRGCIGSLQGKGPLIDTVCEMAVQAATADPRFPPVSAREMTRIELEISVLSEMRRVDPTEVQVGVHGIYVIAKGRRGVLLPQVPQQYGWSQEEFLAQGCRKAGLPLDAWHDSETAVLVFTADVFSESEVVEASETHH